MTKKEIMDTLILADPDNSLLMHGRAKKRLNELEYKGWDANSFYHGWKEGIIEAIHVLAKDEGEE